MEKSLGLARSCWDDPLRRHLSVLSIAQHCSYHRKEKQLLPSTPVRSHRHVWPPPCMFIRERDTPATKQPLHLLQTLFCFLCNAALSCPLSIWPASWSLGFLRSSWWELMSWGAGGRKIKDISTVRNQTAKNRLEGKAILSHSILSRSSNITSDGLPPKPQTVSLLQSLKFLINTLVILVLFNTLENLNSILKPLFLAPWALDSIHSGNQ